MNCSAARMLLPLFVFAVLSAADAGGAVKVYSHAENPRLHPDDARRFVKPPDAAALGGRLQFMAMRSMRDGEEYKKDLDKYVERDRLGNFIWPYVRMVYNTNLVEQVGELKRRGLYLFDLWGYVPGSGPGTRHRAQQFPIPRKSLDLFERELGDRWLGMDTGEQDGRWVCGYAPSLQPFGGDRFRNYLHFQRFFERLHRLNGNRMAALVSLNYGHYLVKEGCYTMLGAETGQALPNSQIYYSFIRGAGKQYGVPWFGNVSVWNRWGVKEYQALGKERWGYSADAGPTKGTSLSLLKRLMYAQIFYNSVAVGFEDGFYNGDDSLSPIGRIQRGAVDWSSENGDPGVMHTPIAIMCDFLSGWCFPRHLYSSLLWRCWGNVPYDEGDFFTDGVLNLLYPRYQDTSYFKDETGFNTPTPFGDCADCILSDAPAWLLRRYPVVVLTSRMRPTDELRDTLREYVRSGGHLVMARGNAKSLFPDGLEAVGGKVTVLESEWGVAPAPQIALPFRPKVEEPYRTPFPIEPAVERKLSEIFREQQIFSPSSSSDPHGLSLVTCRRSRGEYTLCLMNNTWREQPFLISARVGKIVRIEDISPKDCEIGDVGYAPEGIAESLSPGTNTPDRIAAGDVRIFRVKLDEGDEIQDVPAVPQPANPAGRTLALRETGTSVRAEVLRRPTFLRHWDSVMVDWRYLAERSDEALADEENWFRLQGLKTMVDLTGAFNLFPDYRWVDNDLVENPRSARFRDEMLRKAHIWGAGKLVISLHRVPENNMNEQEADADSERTIRDFCLKAKERGIVVIFRQDANRRVPGLATAESWVSRICADNLVPAGSLAAVLAQAGGDVAKAAETIRRSNVNTWFLGAPKNDINGFPVSYSRPVSKSEYSLDGLLSMIAARRCHVVFDAIYPGEDDEYADVKAWERNAGGRRREGAAFADEAESGLDIAAAEFAKYHEAVTGRPPEEGSLRLAIDPSVSGTGKDAYTIVSTDASPARAVVTGSNLRSVFYGVYDLLERRGGCRWFWDGDVVPKKPSIDLSGLDVREEARFEWRGIRYFAHRGLTRFQAEHWGPDDWKREIDWCLKRRLNVFMLRIGQDDLFQRAFPGVCAYPDPSKPLPGAGTGYDDRSLFWPLQFRGQMRHDVQHYAFARGLEVPEDFGTMTHWYSRTPEDFIDKMDPPFLPQATDVYAEKSGLVWDIRDDKWVDEYWKLTKTAVDAYGRPGPGLLHTIGLGERMCYTNRADNLKLKLLALDKFLKRAHRDYPEKKVLLAGWDLFFTWYPEEVQALVKTLDPKRDIIWDYEGDALRDYRPEMRGVQNNFTKWGVVGKFPYTYSIFLAFEDAIDIRANYSVIEKRQKIVQDDPACTGYILWPESSHTDTLCLRYFTANAWSKEAVPVAKVIDEFCASRYGARALQMKRIWDMVLPASQLWHWGENYGKQITRGADSLPDERPQVIVQWKGGVAEALPAFRRLADVEWDGEFVRRDTIDLARTALDRVITLRIYELGRDVAAWRRGGSGESLPARAKRLAALTDLMADTLALHTDYSMWESYLRLDGIEPVRFPGFAKTLVDNASCGYCRSHQYELARHWYAVRMRTAAERLSRAVETNDRKVELFDDPEDERRALMERPLESLRPLLPRTAAQYRSTMLAIADAVGE